MIPSCHTAVLGFVSRAIPHILNHHCTANAPSLMCLASNHHCTITVSSLHHPCTVIAPSLHHPCTIPAPSLKACGVSTSCKRTPPPHHHRTITAPPPCQAWRLSEGSATTATSITTILAGAGMMMAGSYSSSVQVCRHGTITAPLRHHHRRWRPSNGERCSGWC